MIEDMYEGLDWERRLRLSRAKLEGRSGGPGLAPLLCGAVLSFTGLAIIARTLLGDIFWGLVSRLAFETNTIAWTLAGLFLVGLGLAGIIDSAERGRREQHLLDPEAL